ncbi:nucleoside-diphosphate sugar epimerase/dehydratase [Nocardioides sp. cx-173]|uniref:polysaccharide biosynthesis protein n=1 Tax=Nocardioides sp. cx-173 TaxID=2898796 RepID=UPI001E318E4D|nr:nucleoside-diphosphate sugar epimerase/dehydratase [Nocardioides sp. cx-173]MCD4523774.1 polysaccharide biosynthesis protein [Nocardioides sp. cx-173]UGB41902.1 polysaccharide biosynthesis protein [Nocardioides sp. cx-173]
MSDLVPVLRRRRALLSIVYDVVAWVVAYYTVAWLRLDAVDATVPWGGIGLTALATATLYVALASTVRLHQGRAKTGSLDQMLMLGMAVMTAGALVFALNWVGQWIPRSVPAGATLGALVAAAWGRAIWRRMWERDLDLGHGDGVRVIVVGAGEAARELVGSMVRDPTRTWRPVGLLDDDSHKRHLRIRNIPVLGTIDELAEQTSRHEVGTVVIAIPSASAETVDRIRVAALAAGVAVKVLPSTTQLLSHTVGIRDLRDINLSDVLGRNQLDTDIDAIAGYLRGRKVLVTGAGGSIGSELCRQIHRFEPAELMMLDRDESALHAVQLSIHGRALLDSDDVILCDIRDSQAVNAVFASRRPDVVFHAAALKHLPMLEQYPAEAVKTNIVGTRTVLDAADLVDVDRFVNISTDKAANPSSVLGYSKRIAEQVTADRARHASGTYLSVRFGNVLGSRGSVLTSFASQIADGGPVTVTHPEVTRFFMTIEEACQLVIQAAAIGRPGEALVLDMGAPVRILDVAHQLIEQSHLPISIEYTGLREGEKLHEELFGDGEPQDVRPVHPLVSHVPVPPMSDEVTRRLPVQGESAAVRAAMADLCMPGTRSGSGSAFPVAQLSTRK